MQRGAATLVKKPSATQQQQPAKPTKTRVVVLGSGWAAVSFLKNLDPKMFGGAPAAVAPPVLAVACASLLLLLQAGF